MGEEVAEEGVKVRRWPVEGKGSPFLSLSYARPPRLAPAHTTTSSAKRATGQQ